MKSVLKKLLCYLGFHQWVNIDTNATPNPKNGESIMYSELHECTNCKKREYKPMGMII